MGFFFEGITIVSIIIWVVYLIFILLANEFARKSLRNGIIVFAIIPAVMLLFVWPHTAPGTNVMTWFQIAKITSVLVFAYIILAYRFSERVQKIKWFKYLIPLMLAINIMEAVVREMEVSHLSKGLFEGMMYSGGTWNYFNAAAGVINIIVICGFVGIFVSRDKEKTMVWPDMIMWWIIAYDIWNGTYMYNCLGDRSFYVLGPLLAATIAAHFIRKGAWMQHRTFTLGINEIFLFTFPMLFVQSSISVASAWNPTANWTLSLISFGINVSLLVYQAYIVFGKKRNPITEEIYYDTKEYKTSVGEIDWDAHESISK